MKVIKTDNFDREFISDTLVADNVPEFYVLFIVECLNKKFCDYDDSPDFFKAVEDNYVLYKFEP